LHRRFNKIRGGSQLDWSVAQFKIGGPDQVGLSVQKVILPTRSKCFDETDVFAQTVH